VSLKVANTKNIRNLINANDRVIVISPRIAQVSCLFASSTLSLLPPNITILKAARATLITASGAAT